MSFAGFAFIQGESEKEGEWCKTQCRETLCRKVVKKWIVYRNQISISDNIDQGWHMNNVIKPEPLLL